MSSAREPIGIANLYCPIGRKWNHSFLPLGTLYVSAALEDAGIPVAFRDYQVWSKGNPYDLRKIVSFLDVPQRILAIGCMGSMLPFLLKALGEVKRRDPEKIVILGGTGVTGVEDKIMENFSTVDFIVSGEGEETAVELFTALLNGAPVRDIAGISYRTNGKTQANPPRPVIQDIDDIRTPAYGKVDLSRYKIISFITARGCPFRCTFCYSAKFWERFRPRSVSILVDEIEDVVRRSGTKVISILDDTFVLSTERVLEFCEELRRRELGVRWTCFGRVGLMNRENLRALREAGCGGIGFGVESGSNEILDRIKKQITRDEIFETIRLTSEYFRRMEMFLMYGFPFETLDHFNETISLVEALYHELVAEKGIEARFSFNLLAAVAGTELAQEYDNLKRRVPFHKAGYYSHEGKRAMVKRPLPFLPSPNGRWLPRLIDDHPDVFPGFYRFENPDFEHKARIVWKRRKRYRGGR